MPALDLPTTVLLVVVAVAAVMLTLVAVRARIGARSRAHNRVARRGEAAAEGLLRRAGYQIEARQVTGRWQLEVDGVPVPVHCRADLLVRRRRRRFIAEVKSGVLVADPTAPSTRRQLLEYRLAFDVDGVLLVDTVHGRIHEVGFPRT